jgi:hypothetical protein
MLSIELNPVTGVLLSDGAWHDIEAGTLYIEDYCYTISGVPRYNSGYVPAGTHGFTCVSPDGSRISGPLSSILAVRTGTPHDTSTDSRGHSKQQQRTGVNA